MKRFVVLLAVAVLAGQAVGQSAPRVSWYTVPGKPGSVGLWVGDELAGVLDPFEGTWTVGDKSANLRAWVYRENPPKRIGGGPPAGIREDDEPAGKVGPRDNGPPAAGPPGGVRVDRIGRAGERYSVGGREVNRAEALSAIAAGGVGADRVPDDAALPRLTIIGTAAARKPVLDDLERAPTLAYWRGRFVVKDYTADHWRIRDGGFVVPAGPDAVVIYVQKPDGTVIWRQDRYTGADDLARALRDRVPGYDPAKDPHPVSGPGPGPGPGPLPIGPGVGGAGALNVWWLAVPVAVAAVWLAFRRK